MKLTNALTTSTSRSVICSIIERRCSLSKKKKEIREISLGRNRAQFLLQRRQFGGCSDFLVSGGAPSPFPAIL